MDFCTEAECLSDIYEDGGYDFEPYTDFEKAAYIRAKNNAFFESEIGKYVIVQTPRFNRQVMRRLYLVDRSRTKLYWWSHAAWHAMVFDKKEAAESQAKKYRYNKVKVVRITRSMAHFDDFNEEYDD